MIRRALDWLGSARRENDEVNADALRIAALELALRQANLKAMIWQTQAPLVAYAKSRKDSLARYELRRAAK